MDKRLSDKVVLITGAARGQGEAEARLFVAHGAKVVLTDVLDEEGEKVAADIGDDAMFLHHDVQSEEEWKNVSAQTIEHFGTITVLVNNAGILRTGPMLDTTTHEFEEVFSTNQLGCFLGMRTIGRIMADSGTSGSIVNISSVAGLVGSVGLICYTASKHAITGMTKVAALELGPRIRVNSVHPGFVKTKMTEAASGDAGDAIVQRLPLKRAATPLDVAKVALFLASDESDYCTGSEFLVDGGMLAGPLIP